MNIIFLDIDGVVCTLRSHFAYDTAMSNQAWDPTCCRMIKNLCTEYDSKIVVTSVWRLYDNLMPKMKEHKLYKHMHEDWRTIKRREGTRGAEIQEWLDRYKINRYVILDDDSDMLEDQKKWLVLTESFEGFGAKDYIKCKSLLMGEE